jgi:hypothetical protein
LLRRGLRWKSFGGCHLVGCLPMFRRSSMAVYGKISVLSGDYQVVMRLTFDPSSGGV